MMSRPKHTGSKGRRSRKHPRKRLPLLSLIPNLVTLSALVAGLTAIRFAFAGDYEKAVLLVLLAAILDTLDGFLARRLGSDSALGAELDSLADFLDFGVAPALILYLWGLQEMASLGWLAVVVYVVCTALRLARFNVTSREVPGSTRHFIGVPAPAGALLVLSPMFVSFAFAGRDGAISPPPTIVLSAVPVIVGLLMISRFHTWSFKGVTVRRERAPYVILAILFVGAAALTFPWQTLSAIAVGYAASLVWCVLRKDRGAARREAHDPTPREDPSGKGENHSGDQRRADLEETEQHPHETM